MTRLPRAISVTAGALAVLIWICLRRFREERERKNRLAVSNGRASAAKTKPNPERLHTKTPALERREDEPANRLAVEDNAAVCTSSRFNGSWMNHDSGEVHTVEGAVCSAGSFTPLADGNGCILDIHGDVHRGELSSDGQTITWENDDMWRRKDEAGSKPDEALLGVDLVQPGVVAVQAAEKVAVWQVEALALVPAVARARVEGQWQPGSRSGSRFDGLWTNHATGDVQTVEGTSCSAGKFTAAADGTTCTLDVHGEVQRGELSSDGRTITWENDEMWFCEAPIVLQSQAPGVPPMQAQVVSGSGFDGCWTNHDTGDRHTIQDGCCTTGKFTAAADGVHCSLDVDGEMRRGELSSDGRSITWENDMMWFRD